VVGVVLVILMRMLGFVLRFLAMIFYRMGHIMTNVFDLTIVLPLMLERWLATWHQARADAAVDLEVGRP
jgi:hypothetical protein